MFQKILLLIISLLFSLTLCWCQQSKAKISASPEIAAELNNQADDLIYIDNEESLLLAKQALHVAQLCGDVAQESKAQLIIAISHFQKANVDASNDALDQAFAKAYEIKNEELIARAHNLKAAIYQETQHLLKAEETFRIAINLFEKLNDSISVAKGFSNLSTVLNQQGKYYESLEVQHKSMLLFEKFGDTITLSIALLNLSDTYLFVNDYKQALNYSSRALDILVLAGHEKLQVNAHISMGDILKQMRLYEDAHAHFKKALDLISNPHKTVEYGFLMVKVADVYYLLGNHRMALMNNEIGIRELTNFSQSEELVRAYLLKVKILLKLNKTDKAKAMLNKSFAQLIKLNIPDLKKEYYQVSAIYYEATGNYSKSLAFYKHYTELKDSLYQQKNSRDLNNLLNQHENLRKQREIEYQKNELLLKDLELEKNNAQHKTMVLLGLLLVLIAFLVFHRYVSIRKKNTLIASQMDELSFINVKLNRQSLEIKDQNKKLVKYQKNIKDSIQYAECAQHIECCL